MDNETPELPHEMDRQKNSYNLSGFSYTDDRYFPGFGQSQHAHPDHSEQEEADADILRRRHVAIDRAEDHPYAVLGGKCTIMTFESSSEAQAAENALRHHIKGSVPAQLITDEYGKQRKLSEVPSTRLASLQAKVWREFPRVQASRLAYNTSIDCTEHDRISAGDINWIADALADDHVFVLCTSQSQSCSFELCNVLHKTLELRYEPHQISVEPTFDLSTLTPAYDADEFEGQILLFRRDRYKYMEYGQPLKSFLPKPLKAFCHECLAYLWSRRVHSWAIIDTSDNPEEYRLQPPQSSQDSAVGECQEDDDTWGSNSTAVPGAGPEVFPSDESDDGGVSVTSFSQSECPHPSHCSAPAAHDNFTDELQKIHNEALAGTRKARHLYKQRYPNSTDLSVDTAQASTDDVLSQTPDDMLSPDTDEALEAHHSYEPFQLDGSGDMQDHEGSLSGGGESARGSEARPAKLAIRTAKPKLPTSTSAPLLTREKVRTSPTTARSTMSPFWTDAYSKPLSQAFTEAPPSEEALTLLQFLQASATPPKPETVPSNFDKVNHHDMYKGMHIRAPVQRPKFMEYNGLVFPMPPTTDLGPVYLGMPRPKPLDEKLGQIKRKDILNKADKAGTGRKDQLHATEEQTINYWLSPGGPVSLGMVNTSALSTLRASSGNARKLPMKGMIMPSTSHEKAKRKGSPLKQLISTLTPRSFLDKPEVQQSAPESSSKLVPKEDEQTNTTPNSNSRSMAFLNDFRDPLFCYCRNPDDGKKMVQCSNPDCNYGWFHHACLSKPEKVSCANKTRQWTCQVCKLYKQAQTAPSSIDFHFPFLKAEILDALAVPGPNGAVRPNPYGLGLHDPYGVGMPEPSQTSDSDVSEDVEEDREEDDDEMNEAVNEEESRDSGYYGGDEMVE
ncbi:hypothetical protein BDV96DRAFT_595509 [Lophiotrema nucula]|uniref:PHD-type domain-containing protein n=1 Tax=Lophiotrema nucula TaxID=690887 RepID=A0A6A5ZJW5_9PLEO|nr:hypothetical protein BDV96DRAFT_595509 [Lophiotrema nucula]